MSAAPPSGGGPARPLLGAVNGAQGRWRLIGLLLLLLTVISGVMGVNGLSGVHDRSDFSWEELTPWIVCALCLIAALVVAIADLNYLRAHFRSERERLLRAMTEELKQ